MGFLSVVVVSGHPHPSHREGHPCTLDVLPGTHGCDPVSRVRLDQSTNPVVVWLGHVSRVVRSSWSRAVFVHKCLYHHTERKGCKDFRDQYCNNCDQSVEQCWAALVRSSCSVPVSLRFLLSGTYTTERRPVATAFWSTDSASGAGGSGFCKPQRESSTKVCRRLATLRSRQEVVAAPSNSAALEAKARTTCVEFVNPTICFAIIVYVDVNECDDGHMLASSSRPPANALCVSLQCRSYNVQHFAQTSHPEERASS